MLLKTIFFAILFMCFSLSVFSENITVKAKECVNQKHVTQQTANFQFQCGRFYLNGVGVDKNRNKAIQYFTLAADNDHILSAFGLSSLYGSENTSMFNKVMYYEYTKKTIDLYEEHGRKLDNAVGKNVASHLYESLGTSYSNGYGTKKDKKKALYWLNRALKEVDKDLKEELSDIQLSLCLLHYDNGSVASNREEASIWCSKSMKNGNNHAVSVLREIN